MLSAVSKEKFILDLSSEETWSAGQRRVVRFLRKLGYHEVDAKPIGGDGLRDLSPFLSHIFLNLTVIKMCSEY